MSEEKRQPYPGLRAFTSEESDLFFGREGCVDAMVDLLGTTRFLAVLGPSGGGKSSLVRTGLLDALETGLLPTASSRWSIADLHPGGQPMRKLAAALLKVKSGPPADERDVDLMASFLRRGPRSVLEWAGSGNIPSDCNLLILVDQFEELFRYADYAQREEAEAFVAMLLESSLNRKTPIYIVITMRSEYLGACASIGGLAERISAGLYLTPRMDREECREAIVGPAGVVGLKVEPTLVNRMLNDLASFSPWEAIDAGDLAAQLARQADQLPLMQHVLNRLWLRAEQESDGGPVELKLAEYDELGGLSGALDAHGAEVVAELGPDRLGAIESVFRALVSGDSLATAVRRPCRMGELIAAANGARNDVVAIVEASCAPDCNFLRSSDRSLASDEVIVDISHESLIRQWTPLREWLEKEARDGAAWRRLSSAEERYKLGEGGLLTGLDQQSSAVWWDTTKPNATWAARHGGNFEVVAAFLEASRAEEEVRAETERKRLTREKTRLRTLVGVLATVLCIGFVSISADIYSGKKLQEAKQKADSADKTAAAAESKKGYADRKSEEAYKRESEAKIRTLAAEESFKAAIRTIEAARVKVETAEKSVAEAEFRAKSSEDEAKRKMNEADERVKVAEQKAATEVQNAVHDIVVNDANEKKTITPRNEMKQATLQIVSPADPSDRHSLQTAGPSIPGQSVIPLPAVRPVAPISPVQAVTPPSTSEALDSPGSLSAGYRQAEISETHGDAVKAMAIYEDIYNRGLRMIRSLPTGQLLPEADASAFLQDGYDYGWYLLDSRRDAEYERAITTLDAVARSYPEQTASAEILLALANLDNLKSRRSWALNQAADGARYGLESLRLARRAYAAGASPKEGGFLYSRLDFLADSDSVSPADRKKFREEAIALANEMHEKYPNERMTIRMQVSALRKQADAAKLDQKYDLALGYLDQAREILEGTLDADHADQGHSLLMTKILVDEADIWTNKGETARHDDLDRKAKSYLVKALQGKTILENKPGEIKSIYQSLSTVTFNIFDTRESASEGELEFFTSILKAIAPSVKAFSSDPSFAYVYADAALHIGSFLKKDAQKRKEAEGYLSQSAEYFAKSGVMDNPKEFTEEFATVCSVYLRLIELHADAGDTKSAVSDLQRLESTCKPALDASPFDLYLRWRFLDGNLDVGKALVDRGSYTDALQYLQYASKWGVSESSKLLSGLYRDGKGVPTDKAREKQLEELAAKQQMKTFSLPADFSGKKFPFDFYIREWPDEYPYHGIDDQVEWLKKARGGGVAPEVTEAFRKLEKIARDNNVSYAELCAYALDSADKDKDKDKTTASTDTKPDPNEKAKADYEKAQDFYKQKKWDETIKAGKEALKFDPNSSAILALLARTYHDQLFKFDEAYEIYSRLEQMGLRADDFVEANLTTRRYESCVSLAALDMQKTTDKRIRIVMASLEFSCLSAKGHEALDAGRKLRNLIAGLERVNWTFTGTKSFVRGSPDFAPKGADWDHLFEALEEGDEKKAQAALTALGVPEAGK